MVKPIRIPRTTAMFVTGLGHILRDHLGLSITEHEHWVFEHRAEWQQCSNPGRCSWHGVSDEYAAEIYEEHGPGPWPDYDHSYVVACSPYEMNVYLATGQARVQDGKVELRARIEQLHFGLLADDYFTIRIWARREDGSILRGEYGLREDGHTYATDKPIPADPPRRLAFWREPEVPTEAA